MSTIFDLLKIISLHKDLNLYLTYFPRSVTQQFELGILGLQLVGSAHLHNVYSKTGSAANPILEAGVPNPETEVKE